MKIIPSFMFLVLSVLFSVSYAHPYHSPLNFKLHKLPDDKVVYSNLPLSCFKSGLMTCGDYHPVLDVSDLYQSEKNLQANKERLLIKE